MNSQLYESLIKSISKSLKQSLNEGLFDDVTFDDDETVLYSSLMDKMMRDVIEKTLCQHEQYYHPVIPDEEDGLPLILEDPENPLIYYIAPYQTYKTCGFGPRKRKKFSKAYFYRYILEYTEDGIALSQVKFGYKPNIVIDQYMFQFISQSYDKIYSLTFHQPGNEPKPVDPVEKIWVIDGSSKYAKKVFTDKFVKNFPTVINPGESEEFLGETNPISPAMTEIHRDWFTSDNMFIMFVEKLCANGFNIKDENNFVYNQDTLELRKSELLSGTQDQQLADEKDENLQFIQQVLGDEYIEKFNKISQYFEQNGKKFYLKSINTLRTCKIACNDTLYKFQQANNLYPKFNDDYNQFVTNGANVLYKMFCIMKQEGLNDWGIRYDYDDCYEGVDTGFGYRQLDFNDLPLKLDSVGKLYVLYYVMGKAAAQCYGILKDPNEYRRLTSKQIETYDSGKSFSKNMNFDYLTSQLKTIIDKTCKKYKLK